MQDADTAADSDPFAEAFGAPEAVTPTADDGGAQNADSGGQPRDEGGRFASKQEDSADEPAAGGQEQPQPKPEPEKDHRIPIRELRLACQSGWPYGGVFKADRRSDVAGGGELPWGWLQPVHKLGW